MPALVLGVAPCSRDLHLLLGDPGFPVLRGKDHPGMLAKDFGLAPAMDEASALAPRGEEAFAVHGEDRVRRRALQDQVPAPIVIGLLAGGRRLRPWRAAEPSVL